MSNPRQDYDEKRNFIRMKIDIPASITVHSESIDIHGTCRDLSGGGMQVEVDKPLAENTEVDITIASGHGHNPMLKARTRVTRLSAGPGDNYILGLEILAMLE